MERFVRCKRSSLFGRFASDEEKRFKGIEKKPRVTNLLRT